MLLVWCFCYSQQHTNYTVQDGLPSNHVYTILQDTDGHMWFLTDKGISKYNGNDFKSFTTKDGLPNNDIWEGFTTPDGKFWYITKATRLGYIKNDSVYSFENAVKDEVINPMFSSQIGNEVYPTGHRYYYTLKDFKWHKASFKMQGSEQRHYQTIYHRNIDYLLLNVEDSILNIYDKKNKLVKSHYVSSSLIGNIKSRGQLNDSLYFWVSYKDYSILNLNSLELKKTSFKNAFGVEEIRFPAMNLVNDQIQLTGAGFVSVLDNNFNIKETFFFPDEIDAHFGFIDRQNTVWISTFNKGIYKLPKHKSEVEYYFKGEIIQTITEENGQLYAGVFKKGIYKFDNNTSYFEHIIPVQDYIYGIHYIKPLDKLYYLTDHNIFSDNQRLITKEVFKSSTLSTADIEFDVKKIIYHNSKLYTQSHLGIKIINYRTSKIKKEIIQNGVNDILLFNDRIIITTTNGLKQLVNEVPESITFKNKEFNKSVLSIKKLSSTHLLVNTDGFGSFITDLNTIKPLKNSEFLIVQDAFVYDHSIWLATNEGVKYFENQGDSYHLIKSFNRDHGLPSDDVLSIHVTNDRIMAGTNNGLAIIPINHKKKNDNLFMDIKIDKIVYGNESLTDTIVELPYKRNSNLHITLSVIDYNDSSKEQPFYYKLEPLQSEWQTTLSNKVNYYNVRPDNYIFHYKQGGKKKERVIPISPLWSQSIWAQLLLFITLILLIALVVWTFARRLQKRKNKQLLQEKQLTEIQLKALRSQMNPHFVFNSLAAIQYYINNNETEASDLYLVKFSKLIRQFFELSKETEITLDKEINLVTNYLDIEKLRFRDNFSYKINVSNNLNCNNILLPTMLLQPIVENAVNHGVFNKINKGHININITKNTIGILIVEIIDDGVGVVNTTKRNPEKNMKSSNVLKERLRFLNKSGLWKITYTQKELFPKLKDKGNVSTFTILKL